MNITNAPFRNRRARSAMLGAALAVGLLTSSARAHEIGTTQVAVSFAGERRYEIQIVTDAVALVDKLQAAGGEPPSGGSDPARLQADMQALDSRFRRRVVLTFDGMPATPGISYSVASAGAASASTPAWKPVRSPCSRRRSWWSDCPGEDAAGITAASSCRRRRKSRASRSIGRSSGWPRSRPSRAPLPSSSGGARRCRPARRRFEA